MSPFAQLLAEAQGILHKLARRPVMIHFTWDGTDREDSWCCWPDVQLIGGDGAQIFKGMAGEQALRRLVETLRAGS